MHSIASHSRLRIGDTESGHIKEIKSVPFGVSALKRNHTERGAHRALSLICQAKLQAG